MKKAIALSMVLFPFIAFAQRDFDYSLAFSKRVTVTPLTKTTNDTVTTSSTFTIDKRKDSIVLKSDGKQIAIYHVLLRGVQNGVLIYMAGAKEIDVAPAGPAFRVRGVWEEITYSN